MEITGTEKQEAKIAYLGNFAEKLYPEITLESFETAFRKGVASALEQHGFECWSDVASEQPVTRKTFFDSVLEGSRVPLVEAGLKPDQIKDLSEKLSRKNRRYLG